jgi:hypothetical protein
MPRGSALEEGRKLFDAFFGEVKDGYMAQFKSTRVKTRREHLLNEMAVFDKVEGKAYDWFNERMKK